MIGTLLLRLRRWLAPLVLSSLVLCGGLSFLSPLPAFALPGQSFAEVLRQVSSKPNFHVRRFLKGRNNIQAVTATSSYAGLSIIYRFDESVRHRVGAEDIFFHYRDFDFSRRNGPSRAVISLVYDASLAADFMGAKRVDRVRLYHAKNPISIFLGKRFVYQATGDQVTVSSIKSLDNLLRYARMCAVTNCGS